jgi:hypothetical protein
MAGPTSRTDLRAFIAGDPSRLYRIDITDAGMDKLVKAFPNLAVVKLLGACNLRTEAIPAILKIVLPSKQLL